MKHSRNKPLYSPIPSPALLLFLFKQKMQLIMVQKNNWKLTEFWHWRLLLFIQTYCTLLILYRIDPRSLRTQVWGTPWTGCQLITREISLTLSHTLLRNANQPRVYVFQLNWNTQRKSQGEHSRFVYSRDGDVNRTPNPPRLLYSTLCNEYYISISLQ